MLCIILWPWNLFPLAYVFYKLWIPRHCTLPSRGAAAASDPFSCPFVQLFSGFQYHFSGMTNITTHNIPSVVASISSNYIFDWDALRFPKMEFIFFTAAAEQVAVSLSSPPQTRSFFSGKSLLSDLLGVICEIRIFPLNFHWTTFAILLYIHLVCRDSFGALHNLGFHQTE